MELLLWRAMPKVKSVQVVRWEPVPDSEEFALTATPIINWILDHGGAASYHEFVPATTYPDGKGHGDIAEHIRVQGADLNTWHLLPDDYLVYEGKGVFRVEGFAKFTADHTFSGPEGRLVVDDD